LISSNVTEKQTKLDFLGKLITFLEQYLEMPTNVKPAKIISGLEPERTRYLLQLFTVVATTKDLKLGASEETNDQDSPKLEPRIEETASILMEVDKADAVLNQDYFGNGLNNVDSSTQPTSTQPTPKAADVVKPADNIIQDEVGYKFEVTPGAAPGREAVDSTSAQLVTQGKLVDEAPIVPSLANLNARPATARGAKPSVLKQREIESIKTSGVVIPAADIIKDELGCKMHTQPTPEAADVDKPADNIIQDFQLSGRETTPNNIGNGFRLHQNKPATEPSYRAKLLPAQLDIDFQSLARAVCQISQSTTSMGKYINSVPDNVEKMMKERSRWAEAMHNLG
jgi:hypothetical protein